MQGLEPLQVIFMNLDQEEVVQSLCQGHSSRVALPVTNGAERQS